MRHGPALLAVLALLPLACDDESAGAPEDARAGRGPALCARLESHVTGVVRSRSAQELSGLALSRTRPGVLWTHNDSGGGPRVLAVDRRGRLLARLSVTGAVAVDWEDVAAARSRRGGLLYIGDIGDNEAVRSEIAVYRLPEPGRAVRARTAPADRLALRYPDGARDAEALLVDPVTRAPVIVSKDFSGEARVYVARRPSTRRTTALRRAGRLSLGGGEAVTAGDVSADGRTVALRTYDRAFLWSRRRGEPLARVLQRRPCSARALLIGEGQGEALALTANGRAFYTVPEGARPELRRYARAGG
jgi:hypothetical protein